MKIRIILVALCLPCVVLLPHWTYDANRCFGEPGVVGLVEALAAMVVCIVILEAGLQSAVEVRQEEMARRPPEKPAPRPDPAFAFSWAIVILTQMVVLMMFLTTMDGGLRWAAARWVYLVYQIPALLLVAVRWQRWSWGEWLYLRWGWAPILAIGVPLALPRLLAAGWITNPIT